MRAKVEKLDRQGNQIDVKIDQCRYFFSYGRCIAFVSAAGKIYLSAQYWNYSKTTSRYRNQFLCESSEETGQKVESGRYELVDFT